MQHLDLLLQHALSAQHLFAAWDKWRFVGVLKFSKEMFEIQQRDVLLTT